MRIPYGGGCYMVFPNANFLWRGMWSMECLRCTLMKSFKLYLRFLGIISLLLNILLASVMSFLTSANIKFFIEIFFLLRYCLLSALIYTYIRILRTVCFLEFNGKRMLLIQVFFFRFFFFTKQTRKLWLQLCCF